MKKIDIFLFISLILIAIGYRGFREFSILRRGNKLSITKKHTEADNTFKEAITRYNSKIAESNTVVNLYNGMMYRELLDTTNGNHFHRGNSEVYLGEKQQDQKSQIEGYKNALEEYKSAMKVSDDINIKRNYEIIAMRIAEIEKQQQQNQENQSQNEKNNQGQKKRKDGQDEKKDEQQNSQNNDDKPLQNKQGGNKKQDQTGKDNSQNQEQNNEKTQGTPENKKEEKSTETKEALATLEKLENSEEQAFKNNERLEYLGGDTDESW